MVSQPLIELKTTKARYETIRGRITDSVRRARDNHGVRKEFFLIDLGDQELVPELLRALADYNIDRDRNPVTGIWILAGGRIVKIALRTK